VPLLAFLAGVMRSLCDEQWRRYRRLDDLPASNDGSGADDPERACAAAQALAGIRLFASNEAALKVITGLISGLAAEDIRLHYDMTGVEYDTTRRRIRRTMLRRGLAWSWHDSHGFPSIRADGVA
jgi:RNA polymerase sigma-70 factor (ECF subfamily)